jgi:hypothetical protein
METLHFTVGEDTGILLANIAQEHFLYDANIDKALGVFTSSFGEECPKELQLKLLTGQYVIEVDVENQMFMVGEREPHHDKLYPKVIDFVEFFNDRQNQLYDNGKLLSKGLDEIINLLSSKTYRFKFSIDSVLRYIYHNNCDDMLYEIESSTELGQMSLTIKIIKDFIVKSTQLRELSKEVNNYYGLNIQFDTECVFELTIKLQKLMRKEFEYFQTEEEDVFRYIESAMAINEIIEGAKETGFKPVNILDNYSAGWLAPNGDFYGLNGEIANMLHLQISDALQESNIIPKTDEDGNDVHQDSWLEQNGWIRIHGKNIQFGGCLNHKSNKPNVDMTIKQIDEIMNYGIDCHNGILTIGWKRKPMTAVMFAMLAKKCPESLNEKYFSFDYMD